MKTANGWEVAVVALGESHTVDKPVVEMWVMPIVGFSDDFKRIYVPDFNPADCEGVFDINSMDGDTLVAMHVFPVGHGLTKYVTAWMKRIVEDIYGPETTWATPDFPYACIWGKE